MIEQTGRLDHLADFTIVAAELSSLAITTTYWWKQDMPALIQQQGWDASVQTWASNSEPGDYQRFSHKGEDIIIFHRRPK